VLDAIPVFCLSMSRKRRTVADEPFLLVRTSTSDQHGSIAAHTHDWHQLIYVRSGLITVRTAFGSWIAPPTWSVWVPAGVEHAIRFVGNSALRTCYLRPAFGSSLPDVCRALVVSPLLRELIVRATDVGMLDERDPVEAALARLIANELTVASASPSMPPYTLPEPTGPATSAAARLIVDGAAGTARLARAVGVSPRTLERRFQTETGMTLGRWRQHRLLICGLEHIAAGGSVADAAVASGYASPSAYIAAFRKAFASTPGRYFR
jgi:AraC-like DNA-binding protein